MFLVTFAVKDDKPDKETADDIYNERSEREMGNYRIVYPPAKGIAQHTANAAADKNQKDRLHEDELKMFRYDITCEINKNIFRRRHQDCRCRQSGSNR